MNLEPPKNSATEFLLYLWKIVNLPHISREDLIYKISFELFLSPPKKAQSFIEKAIASKMLIFDGENLTLPIRLNKTFQDWQKKRQMEISTKTQREEKKFEAIKEINESKSQGFSTLFNAFLNKGTLNRTVGVSESDFHFEILDLNEGIIKGQVSGSKDDPYIIEINPTNQEIIHNCHDFQTRRAPDKKFCKHLAKLFLILKEKDEEKSCKILEKISEKINSWEFQTS